MDRPAQPFRGIPVLFRGDFAQTLPVVEPGWHTRSQPPNVASMAFISRPATPTKYAINQIFNPTFITIEQSLRFATWSSTNLTAFLGIVNHAVRLVDMEHYSNISVVNTDTKGAGRDHFRLPTDPFLEETTAEREGGASNCLQSLSLQNNNSSNTVLHLQNPTLPRSRTLPRDQQYSA